MNELRYRVTEMESERLQYEKKLKSTKVSYHELGLATYTAVRKHNSADNYLLPKGKLFTSHLFFTRISFFF